MALLNVVGYLVIGATSSQILQPWILQKNFSLVLHLSYNITSNKNTKIWEFKREIY